MIYVLADLAKNLRNVTGDKTMNQEKNNKNFLSIIPGIVLVLAGVVFFLPKLGFFKLDNFWPAYIMAPGIGFGAMYFMAKDKKKVSGLIVPAAITILIGIFFFTLNSIGWDKIQTLWPVILLIIGATFYLYYFATKIDRSILLPANLLTAIGVGFLMFSNYSYSIWPIILIFIGLYLIIVSYIRLSREKTSTFSKNNIKNKSEEEDIEEDPGDEENSNDQIS